MTRTRKYVAVVLIAEVDGSITPRSILWDDGRAWTIERIHSVRRNGVSGAEYDITLHGKRTRLYHDGKAWYVMSERPDGGYYPKAARPTIERDYRK